ncbi:MAG: hypothetical protein LBK06_05700 [Planctomycetaceae bacterium]|jgi:hypothetical protein|nr:hypothetical protein [Planctomycetaceae bacterium]
MNDKGDIDFVVGQVRFRNRVQKIFDVIVLAVFCANVFLVICTCTWFCAGKPPLACPALYLVVQLNLTAVACGVMFVLNAPKHVFNFEFKSATQIDQYYKLKDRVLTAIQICACSGMTPVMQMQIEDAASYISKVDPARVVRYRFGSRVIPAIFFVLTGYCCGLLVDSSLPVNSTGAEFVQVATDNRNEANNVAAKNQIIQEVIDNIRGNNNNNNVNPSAQDQATPNVSEDLRRVRERLRGEVERGIQRLTDSSTLSGSILALSEIEQSVTRAITELDAQSYNLSFQAMAAAFDGAGILRNTAAAIKSEDYDKAAVAIESIAGDDFDKMSAVERKSVSAGLHDAADEMQSRNQDDLEQLTRNFANEIADNARRETLTLTNQIAQKYRQQLARNNSLANLTRQLNEIDRHKSRLIEAYNQELNSSDGNMLSAAQNKTDNLTNPKSNSGNSDVAGNSVGEEPRGQESEKAEERLVLSGVSVDRIDIAGDGANGGGGREVVEVVPDFNSGRVEASEYESLYLRYYRQMESVLEVEAIPFGQRRVIRRYFDSIKPAE